MSLLPFSPKQMDLIHHAISHKTLCCAGGATRSGKSLSTIWSFGTYILDRLDRHHILVGYTLESLSRNIVQDLLKFFHAAGHKASLNHMHGTKILIPLGANEYCKIWLIGANDARARQRLQGATISGAFVDEATNIPEDLWHMMMSRLTFADAKVWATYNPNVPHHWFKEKVEDRIEQLDGIHYRFHFTDNPFLDARTIARYEAALTGPWHDWLVKGIWAGVHGRVYTKWNTEMHQLNSPRTTFGLDWGVATVMAAVRIEQEGMNGNVVDEYHYNAAETGIPLTDSEHAERFDDWARAPGASVYCDPATSPSFKRLLREMGYRVVNARNELDSGLRHTSELLARGRLRISHLCRGLLKEMNSYSWDEKSMIKDKDIPQDRNNHLCDAMRYDAHSTFFDIMDMLLPTRQAGF